MQLGTLDEKNGSTGSNPGIQSWFPAPIPHESLSSWPRGDTIALPKVVSIRFAASPVRCFRYDFPAASAPLAVRPMAGVMPVSAGGGSTPPVPSAKRIRPPDDVVKLHDRLYYLLQPSLETLLRSESLPLPHRPFPYQMDGIGFLYARHAAVLADEMGLGKTMQAITTLRLLLHSREINRVLLICPKPLIGNWVRELALWAAELPVTVVQGGTRQRRWAWQRHEFPIKIANYECILRDQDLVEDTTISADLVVLDEAQRIKNMASSTSRVVSRIQRSRSWALTGTPIENSTDDLVGIFQFLAARLLDRGMTPRRMARATRDYILRRTKEEVLTDLPPKLFRDALLELSPQQQKSYSLAEQEGLLRLTEMGPGVTIQHVFELVLRLKQICNFDPVSGASSKRDSLLADLEEVAASGQKAIVFSQWVDTLVRLGSELQRFSPLQYHGRISTRAREQAMQRFHDRDEHTVLLISYGAGSVGLNLQAASYVFLYDRWWNPAVEDQAINRAHRIGSAGPVTITRFLTPGTIEQRIDDILRQKRELIDAVLDRTDAPRQRGLSHEEIFGLFDLDDRGTHEGP